MEINTLDQLFDKTYQIWEETATNYLDGFFKAEGVTTSEEVSEYIKHININAWPFEALAHKSNELQNHIPAPNCYNFVDLADLCNIEEVVGKDKSGYYSEVRFLEISLGKSDYEEYESACRTAKSPKEAIEVTVKETVNLRIQHRLDEFLEHYTQAYSAKILAEDLRNNLSMNNPSKTKKLKI